MTQRGLGGGWLGASRRLSLPLINDDGATSVTEVVSLTVKTGLIPCGDCLIRTETQTCSAKAS